MQKLGDCGIQICGCTRQGLKVIPSFTFTDMSEPLQCLGIQDKKCQSFMTNLSKDLQSFCLLCCGCHCSWDFPCEVCELWDGGERVKYNDVLSDSKRK